MREGPLSAQHPIPDFHPQIFLSTVGRGRTVVRRAPHCVFFTQGDAADCVYFIQSGRAKLSVLSSDGREATIALLSAGDFVGEDSLEIKSGGRVTTATALTICCALRIERREMVRVLHHEHAFSDVFVKFLLERNARTEANLVDHLFHCSEKRLARILLTIAEHGSPDEPELLLPRITQKELAELVGTTRARVSFFMNRFRKAGLIEYKGRIVLHKARLDLILCD